MMSSYGSRTAALYVMGGKGYKKSPQFAKFKDLCSRAFEILRVNANTLEVLFMLMVSAGMPELMAPNDICYMKNMLHLSEYLHSFLLSLFVLAVTASPIAARRGPRAVRAFLCFASYFSLLIRPQAKASGKRAAERAQKVTRHYVPPLRQLHPQPQARIKASRPAGCRRPGAGGPLLSYSN